MGCVVVFWSMLPASGATDNRSVHITHSPNLTMFNIVIPALERPADVSDNQSLVNVKNEKIIQNGTYEMHEVSFR